MNIKTYFDPKPIPNRNMDWEAWDDDTYDYDQPMGYGRTEREAIEDLKEKLEAKRELAEDHADRMAEAANNIMEQIGDDRCRHGNLHGECSSCDFEGDLAFDAAREDRMFGRR